MEEGEELTVSEERAAPLVTEVSHYISFMIHFLDHFLISFHPSYSIHHPHLQALQKIHLANHIRHMADLLHADTVQQLEVALLGSPAAQVIDLLSGGLMQIKPSTFVAPAQPHPHTYTSTLPTSVPVVGVSTSSHVPVVPPSGVNI